MNLLRFIPKLLAATLSSLYLFTVGWLSARHRQLIWQIYVHFGWNRSRPLLPQIDPTELLKNSLTLNIQNARSRSGNVSLAELVVLAGIVGAHGIRRIFEFGTFDGRTTRNFAAAIPPEGHVFTLDLPRRMLTSTAFSLAHDEAQYADKEVIGACFVGTPEAARITQLLGDSAKFDFSPYCNSMDLVFVDGSHAYEYVLSDSRNAFELLASHKGWILWHDYGGHWPELTRALNYLSLHDQRFQGMQHIAGTTLAVLHCE
ncbi:MAG: class I SAM-dependent methyltransferase [Verrucomicrobia bacterium]|nr:class I SAM-dependent methyltransferase [Verrucomicrobiota bacterium]